MDAVVKIPRETHQYYILEHQLPLESSFLLMFTLGGSRDRSSSWILATQMGDADGILASACPGHDCCRHPGHKMWMGDLIAFQTAQTSHYFNIKAVSL